MARRLCRPYPPYHSRIILFDIAAKCYLLAIMLNILAVCQRRSLVIISSALLSFSYRRRISSAVHDMNISGKLICCNTVSTSLRKKGREREGHSLTQLFIHLCHLGLTV